MTKSAEGKVQMAEAAAGSVPESHKNNSKDNVKESISR